MIIADVETTGLITNEALPLAQQPRIIEIALLKVVDGYTSAGDSFSSFVNPGVPISAEITRITGITDADVKDAPTFAELLPKIAEFFLGQKHFMAHNARFDLMCLVFELRRLDKQWQFPFCPHVIDSRQRYAGKLEEWGREVRGADFVQSHRAMDDVVLLRDCWFSGVRKD